MSLYLITGFPGAGKTTVCYELRERGCIAYDGDKDHLAQWFNIKTGQPVIPEAGQHPPEFLRNHRRLIGRDVVEKLAREAKDKPVFLCNNPGNEAEVLDLFSKVFALIADEATIRHRIATRSGNEWGKLPHELEYSMSFWEETEAVYHGPGYVTIDATKPTDEIVDYILEAIEN